MSEQKPSDKQYPLHNLDTAITDFHKEGPGL